MFKAEVRIFFSHFVRLGIMHLVDENSQHIRLGSLQTPESTTEIKLDIVLLSFHTNSDQNSPLGIEIHPKFMSQEIAKPSRVEAEVCATDNIMFSNKCAISNGDHKPQRLIYR